MLAQLASKTILMTRPELPLPETKVPPDPLPLPVPHAATVTNNVIDLSHSEFADLAAVQADLHAAINSAGLTHDATDSITLTHLQIQSLHAQNFHFF
jgi:hypothetical protein